MGEWRDKPLPYHLEAKPHTFLGCMYRMSAEREEEGIAFHQASLHLECDSAPPPFREAVA